MVSWQLTQIHASQSGFVKNLPILIRSIKKKKKKKKKLAQRQTPKNCSVKKKKKKEPVMK